jgi:hypothetical protein
MQQAHEQHRDLREAAFPTFEETFSSPPPAIRFEITSGSPEEHDDVPAKPNELNPLRRTRQKLDEAAYFLGKVREHYFDVLEDKGRPLVYYVSAFVSAARSVGWVMRNECASLKGWEAWYKAREPAVEDRPLLRQFKDIRNRSQKAEPLHIGTSLKVSAVHKASPESQQRRASTDPKFRQYRVTLTALDESKQPILDPQSLKPRTMEAKIDAIECLLPELGKEDLLDCCSRYYTLLEVLVADCEARFPDTQI